jgi:hypothetical protein
MLNFSYRLLRNDPFEILRNYGLIDYYTTLTSVSIGLSTGQSTHIIYPTWSRYSTPKLTTSNALLDHSTLNSHSEFSIVPPCIGDICLPRWVTKTTKVVDVDAGNINDSRNTRGW